MSKKRIFRLPSGTVAYLEMNSVQQILRDKGLHETGDVQQFHTANVLRRIIKYMPFLSGMLIKLTIVQTVTSRPEIVTDAPEGQYLFRGKVMVDPKNGAAGFMTPEGWRSRKGCVKVRTSRDLKYTKTKNPRAGPRWDIAVSTREGKAMAADAQRYIERKR